MIDYSRLQGEIKRKIVIFGEKMSKDFSKPDAKFIIQMIYGVLCSQSVHLSEIARSLQEKISLKKTIDRLSRNLATFQEKAKLMEAYISKVKKLTNDRSILIIDGSDVIKPAGKVLEDLCKVRDGSSGKYGMGYHVLEITALSEKYKMPVPVYTKVYSHENNEFISEDEEVLTGLKVLSKHFKKQNIRAMDRGYDANVYYKYFLERKERFVIRATQNRNVIYKGKTINILELAKQFKGKYSLKFEGQKGETKYCKIAIVPVQLPCMKEETINLVVVYGFGEKPMLLLSNLMFSDKSLAVALTKVYLMRWRIEEYYRFKKQQFEFEDFRVRSMQSIENLNLIVTMAIGLIGELSGKQDERLYVMEIIHASKRIYGKRPFVYYAIADGIADVLRRAAVGINHFLRHFEPLDPRQIVLFDKRRFCF